MRLLRWASPKIVVAIAVLLVLVLGLFLFREPLLKQVGFGDKSAAIAKQDDPGHEKDWYEYLSPMMERNEQVWPEVLGQYGFEFRPARLVVYRDRVEIPGGSAAAGSGPFYLPGEETIYMDASFLEELQARFPDAGEFTVAYVVAHEYGHHVQAILGRLEERQSLYGRIPDEEYQQFLLRTELHADFLAGLFAGQAFGDFLDQGDIEEAIRCASAIGQDRPTPEYGRGDFHPDSFNHGTVAQRLRWFDTGFASGDLKAGETLYALPFTEI